MVCAGMPVPREKTTIRPRRRSRTAASPEGVKATATGSGRIVGPGAGDPHTAASEPSGLSSCTRPLTASVTARSPPASAATPTGSSNWPGARPEAPKLRSRLPEASKTSMRSLPVSAT